MTMSSTPASAGAAPAVEPAAADGRSGVSIRSSRPSDLAAVTAIYERHVLVGSGTFETEAPDQVEMARRRDEVLARGWPWLVAEQDGRVIGHAYAGDFRARRAYRFCVEDSVYLDAGCVGRGIGKLLLADLIARCEAAGARQMIAVIGDSANVASIGLHRALGFSDAGLMSAVGWKLGRWLDVVLMQRRLGVGADSAPGEPA